MASPEDRKRKRPRVGTDFINSDELAERLGVSIQVLTKSIADGHMPPPWAALSVRTKLWRRDHYEHFLATGLWPAESVRKRR